MTEPKPNRKVSDAYLNLGMALREAGQLAGAAACLSSGDCVVPLKTLPLTWPLAWC